MRNMIAAFRVSVDGYIQGPNGEVDWVENWEDAFDLMPRIDACVMGAGMYPGYELYWSTILSNPAGELPMTGKVASPGEVRWARFAEKTPHFVLSKTLGAASWKSARIVRDVEEIRKLKEQPGKDIYAIGGPTLVSSLMSLGLIDELRLMVHPVVLGGGKPLSNDLKRRQGLTLVKTEPLKRGIVRLTYNAQS